MSAETAPAPVTFGEAEQTTAGRLRLGDFVEIVHPYRNVRGMRVNSGVRELRNASTSRTPKIAVGFLAARESLFVLHVQTPVTVRRITTGATA